LLFAKCKNIHVIPFNLHEEIKGFYKYDKHNKYIFINNNLDDSAQKFVCAHEFGHSQIHSRVNTPFLRKNTLFSTDCVEVEANRFAFELLIPDDSFEYETTNLTIREVSAS
jgi:Zn-dependent peptidase ImmA (M78 family)